MTAKVQVGISPPQEPMNCMEVWGGNGAAAKSFSMPGLDVWISSRPTEASEIVGGDVHFLSSCASGRITRMLLADICGSSSVFADLASEMRHIMMRNVNSITQKRFVRETHERLRDFSDRGGFATALVGTFFAPTRSFSLCNAGHPTPLVYRSAAQQWEVVKAVPAEDLFDAESHPGVLSYHEYQQIETQLDCGDMILGFSNVLTECKDSYGHILGVNGLLDTVREIDASAPSEIVAALIDLLRDSHDSNLHHNDATVLLCRGTERSVGWKNNMLAPLRLFRSVSDNTRLA